MITSFSLLEPWVPHGTNQIRSSRSPTPWSASSGPPPNVPCTPSWLRSGDGKRTGLWVCYSHCPVFRFAKFMIVMFKYLACYVLSIYFQWQWNPHRPDMLLRIFLTKAHYLLQPNHLFPQPLRPLHHHRHIVLLPNSIIIIKARQQATDSFQTPKHPRRPHHRDLKHPLVIIPVIYFPHTHPRMLCTDLATTQSQRAPSKLKLW